MKIFSAKKDVECLFFIKLRSGKTLNKIVENYDFELFKNIVEEFVDTDKNDEIEVMMCLVDDEIFYTMENFICNRIKIFGVTAETKLRGVKVKLLMELKKY